MDQVQNGQAGRFPWWLSSKESACQCRRHGFDPWARGFHRPQSNTARVSQLLSLCSRAWEPQVLKPAHLEPVLHNEKPCTATREKPTCAPRPSTAEKKGQVGACYSKGGGRLREDMQGGMHSLAGVGWLPEALPAVGAGRAGGRWPGEQQRPGRPPWSVKGSGFTLDGSH